MEKSYKLIKEYPGSAPLGAIAEPYRDDTFYSHKVTNNSVTLGCINKENLIKYPEFWKEVIPKDYQILSWITGSGKLENSESNEVGFNSTFDKIYSVKRISDSEIFTIGDNCYPDSVKNNTGILDKIWFCDPGYLRFSSMFKYTIGIETICKVKKPLFKTEDSVDIFEGDEDVYYIDTVNLRSVSKSSPTICSTSQKSGYIFYKSKEKAEEHILMNKPLLSLQNVLDCFKFSEPIQYKKLTELVKSKL